jgi:hypothetical protein
MRTFFGDGHSTQKLPLHGKEDIHRNNRRLTISTSTFCGREYRHVFHLQWKDNRVTTALVSQKVKTQRERSMMTPSTSHSSLFCKRKFEQMKGSRFSSFRMPSPNLALLTDTPLEPTTFSRKRCRRCNMTLYQRKGHSHHKACRKCSHLPLFVGNPSVMDTISTYHCINASTNINCLR